MSDTVLVFNCVCLFHLFDRVSTALGYRAGRYNGDILESYPLNIDNGKWKSTHTLLTYLCMFLCQLSVASQQSFFFFKVWSQTILKTGQVCVLIGGRAIHREQRAVHSALSAVQHLLVIRVSSVVYNVTAARRSDKYSTFLNAALSLSISSLLDHRWLLFCVPG